MALYKQGACLKQMSEMTKSHHALQNTSPGAFRWPTFPLDGSHPLLQTNVLAHFPKGKEEIQNPLDICVTDTLCHTAETNKTL